jgi:hypothetical protein
VGDPLYGDEPRPIKHPTVPEAPLQKDPKVPRRVLSDDEAEDEISLREWDARWDDDDDWWGR